MKMASLFVGTSCVLVATLGLGACASNSGSPEEGVAESGFYGLPGSAIERLRCTTSTTVVSSDARAPRSIPPSFSFDLARWVRINDYSLRGDARSEDRRRVVYEIGAAGGDSSSMRALTLAAFGVVSNYNGSFDAQGHLVPGRPADSFWGSRSFTLRVADSGIGVTTMFGTVLSDGFKTSAPPPAMPPLSQTFSFSASTQSQTTSSRYQTADNQNVDMLLLEKTIRFASSARGIVVSGTISNHTDSHDWVSEAVPFVSTVEFAGNCDPVSR